MTAPRLRMALAVTGPLLVGAARIALANWQFARRLGGRIALRLDDAETARPGRDATEQVEAIRHDLRWLGLDWDSETRQSARRDRYAEAAEALKSAGRLYPCFESEAELNAKRERRLRQGHPAIYDRAMLKLTPAQREAAEAGGKSPYLAVPPVRHDRRVGRPCPWPSPCEAANAVRPGGDPRRRHAARRLRRRGRRSG